MVPLEILKILPAKIKDRINSLDRKWLAAIEEIRLRVNYPLHIISGCGEGFIDEKGNLSQEIQGLTVTKKDLEQVLFTLSGGSLYTLEEEMPWGFTTIRGGHRIGFAGQVFSRGDVIENLTQVTFMNIRIAKEVKGVAEPLLPYLLNPSQRRYFSTMLISPPGAGKTTLLRDLIRLSSTGAPNLGLLPVKVGLLDERSEIAGSYQGVPQLDVGPRTDVLSGCSKNKGLLLLIRAMSPEVLACDELGQEKDFQVLAEVARVGARMITTVHGSSFQDLKSRPLLKNILGHNFFQRFVVLSSRDGPGTVEEVLEEEGKVLWQREG